MIYTKKIALLFGLLFVAVTVVFALLSKPATAPVVSEIPNPTSTSALRDPISNARSRVTKKPFGIYVTLKTSPVQPERFTGYHTGVDFETYPDEQDRDVAIMAVCTGPLVLKQVGSGYGGMAVQRCDIDGSPVSVTYGHVRLTSITAKVGDTLTVGKKFAVLGTGYSKETDGERKHLHLGIHRGVTTNTRGYVATQAELSQWIDFLKL